MTIAVKNPPAALPTLRTSSNTSVQPHARASTTTAHVDRTPNANVGGSVGGKAIGGAVASVRVGGRDVDVMFPAGAADFGAYIAALQKSGAFTAQSAQLAKLATTSTTMASTAVVDKRPVVGIILSEPKMLLAGGHKNTDNIIALVEKMGCRPVLIPPCADVLVPGGPAARAKAISALASQLDGLVGPGGADVDPSIYGEASTLSVNTNVFRDTFEADFVKTALDCDLFGFGICRSHQLWNVAAGGKLVQDVEAEKLTSVTHKGGVFHPLMIKRGSMIYEATRQEMLRVNSYHHQAVDFTGWGFRVVATTHDAGTGKDMIEATERWNGITTQYHPELMQDDAAQRALFSTVGRRAHVFALVKELRREGGGAVSLATLLDRMRANMQTFDKTDVEWAKSELGRRL